MKSKIRTNVFFMMLVALLSASAASAAGIGNNIVVVLAGTDTAYNGDEQFEEFGLDAVGALCFEMDLIDAKTGYVIGSGSDCLSDINEQTNGGMSLTATTFFHFPGGTLISRGLVTVQPKIPGLKSDGLVDYTHVTGAAPALDENSVIYGDGRFRRATGSVRLSGLVNLSELQSAGKIVFDCVFILDIRSKRPWWSKRFHGW